MKLPRTISDQPGIYLIRCRVNGKVYVGSSLILRTRLVNHRSQLLRGIHYNDHLQRAWNKYGRHAFEVEILALVDPEQLRDQERHFILSRQADDPAYGFNHTTITDEGAERRSDATRQKLREAGVGRVLPDAVREKIRASRLAMPEDARAATGKGNLGRKHSPEARANMGNARQGKTHSDSRRAAIAEGMRRKWAARTAEERAALSNAQAKKPLSDTHKAAIAEGQRRRWARLKSLSSE